MSKSKGTKRFVGFIDIEPTWAGLLPILLQLWREKKDEPTVLAELQKMARAADAYRALQKEGKVP